MKVELIKEFFVEAAHRDVTRTGPQARLHGHSFRIEIVVEGEVDPGKGWLIDYGDIGDAFRPLRDQLDHAFLNEIEGLERGTLDDVAAWIKQRLQPALPCLKDVLVSLMNQDVFLLVELPPDTRHRLPRRYRFSIEAAQSLPHLPTGHPCRRLHGHTYRIEVGAANLEDLREPLRALYQVLDHESLNEIPGLREATSERLCAWTWDRLAPEVAGLQVVVVQETNSARCIYRGH